MREKVYAVLDRDGYYEGYAYKDEELANKHASTIWCGWVQKLEIYNELPEFVTELLEHKE